MRSVPFRATLRQSTSFCFSIAGPFPLLRGSFFVLLGFCALAGCSSPQRVATRAIDPRYGVAPSPRVVAEGEEVPKGGGVYMVGEPYKIAGKTYYPSERPYSAMGLASWYGADFHGRKTANGEVFDRGSISAAHPTMPLPSYARITNLRNARSMIVRVNDRGPYHGGRVMDVSERAAEALDFRRSGSTRVKVEYLGRAGLAGSDDSKLLATLRDDGQPATLEGGTPVMTAEANPVRIASNEETPAKEEASAAASDDDDDEAAATPAARVEILRAAAPTTPLPPSRPFDLGAAPATNAPTKATGKGKDSIGALLNSLRPNRRT